MIELNLTDSEEKCLERHQLFTNTLKTCDHKLHLNKEQTDQQRDILGDLLQDIGFDEKYGLTDEGKTIETLIDKLLIK
jgi:hypothetical protein